MKPFEHSGLTGTIDVVVIGAGHAGLAMSYFLDAAGIDHVVLERGKVANSWATERWDSLRLLTPNWQSRLPGIDAEADDPDGFREALRAADFEATRGDFKFGVNHHPIQDIYVREVVQEGEIFTNRTIAKVADDYVDSYAADCKM